MASPVSVSRANLEVLTKVDTSSVSRMNLEILAPVVVTSVSRVTLEALVPFTQQQPAKRRKHLWIIT